MKRLIQDSLGIYIFLPLQYFVVQLLFSYITASHTSNVYCINTSFYNNNSKTFGQITSSTSIINIKEYSPEINNTSLKHFKQYVKIGINRFCKKASNYSPGSEIFHLSKFYFALYKYVNTFIIHALMDLTTILMRQNQLMQCIEKSDTAFERNQVLLIVL